MDPTKHTETVSIELRSQEKRLIYYKIAFGPQDDGAEVSLALRETFLHPIQSTRLIWWAYKISKLSAEERSQAMKARIAELAEQEIPFDAEINEDGVVRRY